MQLLEKYKFLSRGSIVEVRAEALLDKFHRKGGDGSSEVEGYEGSWRRATVVEHLKKEKSDKRRWVVIQLVDPKSMYKTWKPLGKGKQPPLPIRCNDLGEAEDEEEEEDSDSDHPCAEFEVAPLDLRPWIPFTDTSVWPQSDIKELKVGHAVLYVDGIDECARWRCWVRRVFQDGAWLWVKGPEPGLPPWGLENHHVSCCQRSSPCWRSNFGKDRSVFPMEDHLRRERVYDLDSGQWAWLDERVYWDPLWQRSGRISGHSPTRQARLVPAADADAQRMRAATAAVSAAIADGALPAELQGFVGSFDIEARLAAAAPDGDAAVLADMVADPLFRDTFCGLLLDSLRQDSPVTRAGVAVFEQIKVTFKQDAVALQEHLAREYAKAHFL